MEYIVRMAKKEDIQEILGIYEPYILHTTITFEYEVPTLEEFEKRLEKIQEQYPWLVCEINGEIIGYAYASAFRARMAFSWGTELSVYTNEKYLGLHIGRILYEKLIQLLKEQGYYNVYALISIPNEKSIYLHKMLGFEEEGVQKKVGFKLGKWCDLVYLVKNINRYDEYPKELPRSIQQIEKETIEAILKKRKEL
jgi:Sortase and related acyltransferases